MKTAIKNFLIFLLGLGHIAFFLICAVLAVIPFAVCTIYEIGLDALDYMRKD